MEINATCHSLITAAPQTDLLNSVPGSEAQWKYAFPAIVDGNRSVQGHAEVQLSASAPPADLAGSASKHWLGGAGVTWQTAGAVNAQTACGALGDGKVDDWAALQKCVRAHKVVYLPKGFYRLSKVSLNRFLWLLAQRLLAPSQQLIVFAPRLLMLDQRLTSLSKPLVLEAPGAALVGVGKTLSILMPIR